MPKNDIKEFIDFFHEASKKIRDVSPKIVRGRDGKLTERALKKFSRTQLEMMAVWFLAKKQKLAPAIGTMLSKALMEELELKLKNHAFWKELDEIYERYFPRQTMLNELFKKK
ncbi:hypothetical protein A2W54_02875 [Candidatus Giovannonibacteria bacterium RIFCSPHIGHO2_02_43_13]|uniref:Uncharacterized protein n=1 Tax=Candidatus Giovannonibacteria bacterium RIFCSPHIGHO2_02_43_13 TaxID=1798330 RepID=A0A1F5WPV1_9BACT|nr:MAG: hypothetical protein UW28_C0003G0038 [Parcubacteria group bacterium GW2011_GWA2_44_13]OGF72525.1 MAG: hypothetical protein A3E06_03955 [Candidatus Giovannonibacteria bacterium RIFCSPHIGHO2_12_FULL_44_42]OGF77686.1 MAG: hypothetical protein A2W54_02875 [Candidatus Giovannonibacteria bacterium RIFCSPHIGHO2_02_43_13]OGF88968.1 MAG: hypothetical protein A3I94_03615 [Candidatus Giovannonibacteria bacterium RIFCSPLOWO2_02_FULL_43_54]OGF97404.1 MAG: hypothetical protein A3H08_03965 [Candidatus